jgi:serine/threonine-protein phosphatase 6 regulatory ankyrin repeat subunit B
MILSNRLESIVVPTENIGEDVVRGFLNHSANIRPQDANETSALICMSRGGDLSVVKLESENQIHVLDERNNSGWKSVIYTWDQDQNTECSIFCENSDSVVEARDKRRMSALMHVARYGHEEMVKVLIKSGADVNAQDRGGWTALVYASRYGHDAVVKVLIESGAMLDGEDTDGYTALMYASAKGHDTMVKVLVNNGANVNAQNIHGYLALMHASANGRDSVVNVLIKSGANVNAQDNNGYTALMIASMHSNKEIVRLLLEANADVNLTKLNVSQTALMFATSYIYKKTELCMSIIEQLLRAGADASMQDIEGNTFIKYAPVEYRNQLQELVDKYELTGGYQNGQLK